MKILFYLDKRDNAGSIQAVANYVSAGEELGITVAVYGGREANFPRIRFSTEVEAFEHVVFIVESRLEWLSGLRLPRVLMSVPRGRRAVLDADGAYNRRICIDGYDRNHASENERTRWLAYFNELADKIMQPTLAPAEPEVVPLPFYGYDPKAQIAPEASPAKRFDIAHVGHNWWRGHEVSQHLLPAFEQIRSSVGSIAFIGLWWDAIPAWAGRLGLEHAFCLDFERFRRLQITVEPPVSFTRVIGAMSEARVNIMTQRPLLRHFRLLTSKYFEIFCADTIPLVVLDPDDAERVYGPAGRELSLNGSVAEKLLDALERPGRYREVVAEVRQHLGEHHSYRQRLCELVEALKGGSRL
jgi:hypothetical protein